MANSEKLNCADEKIKQEVCQMLEQFDKDKQHLISILNEVQEKYGYIPEFAQDGIAEYLGLEKAEIYGVITFYSAQAKLIKDMLKAKDISEKVRVGSVDAFQGMEFDVVYLSVVRSNKSREYGFLQMEYRLCVAMSRQKRRTHR